MLDRDFIRLIWHNELFDELDMLFSDRARYSVLSVGTPSMQDPYIFNGAELVDLNSSRTIRGAVRIDQKSSHWHNEAIGDHNNIVLHLVAQRDKHILTPQGEQLTAQITPRADLIRMGERMALDCSEYFSGLDRIQRETIMLRLVSDRLERKGGLVVDLYHKMQDWREVLYVTFFRSFGYKDKKDDFQRLALSVPYRYIVRHARRPYLVEAMLLGQAGYLDVDHPDHYTIQLQSEWRAIRAENAMSEPILDWKSANTRPQSMPAISIVRAVAVLTSVENLMECVLNADNARDLSSIFDVSLNVYWRYHYAPSRMSTGSFYGANLSQDKLDLIVINAISPFLWAYGTINRKEELVDRAIELLDQINGEKNLYTRRFATHQAPLDRAFDSQAVIELCTMYCTPGKCSACPIGSYRLKQTYRKRQP